MEKAHQRKLQKPEIPGTSTCNSRVSVVAANGSPALASDKCIVYCALECACMCIQVERCDSILHAR